MARDTTDTVDDKFGRAMDIIEKGYDDRWPARGKAGQKSGEYRPLEDVTREDDRRVPYRKWPSA